MIVLDLSILNQKGTPMFYSDVLSARPNFGIVGRIFIATDSPYGLFRDTGTSWVQIAGSGGGGTISGSGTATQVAYFTSSSAIGSSSNLFWDNTNGRIGINTSTPGASVDAHGTSGNIIQANATGLGNSQMAFQLQGTSKWQIGNVYQSGSNYFRINDALSSVERVKVQNTGEFDIQGWEVLINTQSGLSGITTIPYNNSFTNNYTYNSGLSTIASFNSIGVLVDNVYNFSGANTINATSYNASLVLRSNMTFATSSASITYTQATGIRALSNKQSIYQQSGANSGTISHYANLQIFGDQKLGAGTTTFTNRYQVLLNDYDEFTAGNTYTNRWAIYQAGASNNNYFAGKIITGTSTTVGTYQLDVTGTTRLNGDTTFGTLATGTGMFWDNTNNRLGIGTSTPSYPVHVLRNVNSGSSALYNIKNSSNGNAAVAGYQVESDVYSASMFLTSSTYAGAGVLGTNTLGFYSPSPVNIAISSGADLKFSTGGTNEKARMFSATGNLILQNSGTFTDVASSRLTVNSTTQGFLPPRMTLTQRNAISSPASGLLVINSTDATLDGYDGTAAAWYQSVRSDNGYVKVNATTSGTTGAASGQYLQINVNGTSYKLLLLNP